MSQETRFRNAEGQYELFAPEPDDVQHSVDRLSRWIGAVLFAALLVLLFSGVASAHHQSNHRVLIIGEWTKVVVQMPVCDSMSDAMDILSPDTLEASIARYRHYTTKRNDIGQQVCGNVEAPIKPLEIMHQTAKYGDMVTVVRFLAPNGTEYYALLVNIPVIEKANMDDTGI